MKANRGYSVDPDGDVVLTMSVGDFHELLFCMASATYAALRDPEEYERVIGLLNRLNMGNPHFTPYAIGAFRA